MSSSSNSSSQLELDEIAGPIDISELKFHKGVRSKGLKSVYDNNNCYDNNNII